MKRKNEEERPQGVESISLVWDVIELKGQSLEFSRWRRACLQGGQGTKEKVRDQPELSYQEKSLGQSSFVNRRHKKTGTDRLSSFFKSPSHGNNSPSALSLRHHPTGQESKAILLDCRLSLSSFISSCCRVKQSTNVLPHNHRGPLCCGCRPLRLDCCWSSSSSSFSYPLLRC